ncbi:expressed unknown protein [Seminavis robusta]|uniref:Uncharacterized protein n=1 Tax=Seminavis robusta TaxID=568900 RepID=A0A9N8DJN0_9STRA|nr:expressed unknown protein [Seminavis robusta]|eukprot:Sro194_g083020.1 n/a (283) ;mRNA; f:81453-82441
MMRRRSSSDPAASGIKRHSSIKQNAGRPRRQTSPPRQPRPSRGKSMDSALMSGWRHIKGIMKITTLDESLHSKYGSADSKATGNRPEHITFKNIEIREYNRTVGDNPSVSSGPPVTISWEYNPNTLVLAVEEYEKSRPVRRTQSEMILPRSIRMEMLRKEWDVSRGQIAGAVRRGIRAKNQRRTTLGNLGKTEKVEEMIEGATKTLLKTLFLRKSTSKRAKELGEQIQKVNNQRAQIVLQHTMKGEYVETGIDESDSSSPWLAELMPDESETDRGASSLLRQ